MPGPLVMPIAALALQAGSMASSYFGGKEAKSNAKDAAKHDAELVRAQAEVQTQTILEARTEAEKQAVQNISGMARQAAIERGRILAGAGEAGGAGGSVSSQLLASYQREAEARGSEIYNLKAYKRQAVRDIAAVEAGLQVNIPKYEGGSSASGFATILAGAASMLQTYHAMK